MGNLNASDVLKDVGYEPKEKDVELNPSAVFGLEAQARHFIKHQPLYYDRSGMWWMWSHEKTRWEMTDIIDVLNGIKKYGVDTISSKSKTEITNALTQVAREKAPEIITKNWTQFRDKIVDIETGDVFDASPKYFLTNPLPFGVGNSENTPTLDKYFKEWVVKDGLQNETYVDTLYEIIAYSTFSRQFLQRLFAFVGSGSNGKGIFLSIIEKFLGEDNCCSSELKILSTNNFETSGLYKKQACFMGEVDAYDMQNTNLIKKLSGEDGIRYCFKGKTPFTENSSTTCFMNSNSLPVTPDKSKGFYRRWMIVDFPHEFPVGRDILSEISEQEFENLSRKVIRISQELLKNKKFTNEGDLDTRIKRYEDRSNPIMSFINDYCEESFEFDMPVMTFIKMLNKYLVKNRLRIMNPSTIKAALKKEGFDIDRKTREFNMEMKKIPCVMCLKLKDDKVLDSLDSLDSFLDIDTPWGMSSEKPVFSVQTVQKKGEIPKNHEIIDFSEPKDKNEDNFDKLSKEYKKEGLID